MTTRTHLWPLRLVLWLHSLHLPGICSWQCVKISWPNQGETSTCNSESHSPERKHGGSMGSPAKGCQNVSLVCKLCDASPQFGIKLPTFWGMVLIFKGSTGTPRHPHKQISHIHNSGWLGPAPHSHAPPRKPTISAKWGPAAESGWLRGYFGTTVYSSGCNFYMFQVWIFWVVAVSQHVASIRSWQSVPVTVSHNRLHLTNMLQLGLIAAYGNIMHILQQSMHESEWNIMLKLVCLRKTWKSTHKLSNDKRLRSEWQVWDGKL